MGRMDELMEKAKREGLTEPERAELQKHFLRIALQDLAMLEDQGLLEKKPKSEIVPLRDRACLAGIIFVLRSGIPWEMLPQGLGYSSGMTCWRRVRDWQEAGIWQLIHLVILDWLARCEKIDWSRAVVDGSGSGKCICRLNHWIPSAQPPSFVFGESDGTDDIRLEQRYNMEQC